MFLPDSLCVFLFSAFVFLSVNLFSSLFLSVSPFSFVCLSVCLSISLSIYSYDYMSHPFVLISICLSSLSLISLLHRRGETRIRNEKLLHPDEEILQETRGIIMHPSAILRYPASSEPHSLPSGAPHTAAKPRPA